MINILLQKFAAGVLATAISVSSLLGGASIPEQIIGDIARDSIRQEFGNVTLGANQVNFVGGKPYFLSAGISTTDTTITLTSFKQPISNLNLSMSDFGSIGYATLEPNSSTRKEFISFTGVSQNSNGTASLTGVTRGLAFTSPYTASTTLRQSHSGGTTLVISNPPQLYNEAAFKGNNETITGTWSFSWPAASTTPATKGYVDYVAFNGAGVVDATTIARGVVELATQLETASSTSAGSAGNLVIPASAATSTYNSATAGLRVVVTQNNGKIDNNFLSGVILPSGNNTFTGSNAFSTSTGATTTIGSFPAWEIGKQVQMFTTTGTSTFSVPQGITKVRVRVVGGGGTGASANGDTSGGGGGGGGYCEKYVDVSATTSIQVYVGAAGQWSTFGTNGFYCIADKGSNGSSRAGGTGGNASGGDINVQGGGGAAGSSNGTAGSGAGGSSVLGGGGAGVEPGGSNGNGGGNYGGGGSGAADAAGGGSFGGGAGAQGVVIVNW